MNELQQKISAIGVVPVIKLTNPTRDAKPLADALCAGGVPVAEITFRAAGAADAIRIMAESHPEMLVGAGTVLTTAQVDEAVNAGESFIVTPGIDIDIEGRDIIIVEDIVETGHSINHMLQYIKSLNPNSVEVCTLFFKPEKYLYDLPIKYCAMEIGNEFIVGYGLDYDQLGRNLKDIYVLAND